MIYINSLSFQILDLDYPVTIAVQKIECFLSRRHPWIIAILHLLKGHPGLSVSTAILHPCIQDP